MAFGVAQHASGQFGVAFVPAIDCKKADPKPLIWILDVPPGPGLRQRVALERQSPAGQIKAPLIGKMRVTRVPLNTGPLGDHADRRERRSDASMQIDGGLDDALPG